MIITKSTPFTEEEIERLKEVFDVYIKTVIDIRKKICSAGMDRHYEGEEILLEQGSRSDLMIIIPVMRFKILRLDRYMKT